MTIDSLGNCQGKTFIKYFKDDKMTCINKLAGCIIVQNVETPALAATIPVLARSLNDKFEGVKRTCYQIVNSMCKWSRLQ